MTMTRQRQARLELLWMRSSVHTGVAMTSDDAARHSSLLACAVVDQLSSPRVLFVAAANLQLARYQQPVQGKAQYAGEARASQCRVRMESGHALAIPQVPPDISLHAPGIDLGTAESHAHILSIHLPIIDAVYDNHLCCQGGHRERLANTKTRTSRQDALQYCSNMHAHIAVEHASRAVCALNWSPSFHIDSASLATTSRPACARMLVSCHASEHGESCTSNEPSMTWAC